MLTGVLWKAAYSTPSCNATWLWHSRLAAHGVFQGLEEELVCEQVHSKLLIAKGVDAVGSSTGGCPDLQQCPHSALLLQAFMQ